MSGGEFIRLEKDYVFNSLVVLASLVAPAISTDKLVITSPPMNPTDATNKAYVDSIIAGMVNGPNTTIDRSIAVWNGTNGLTLADSPTTIDLLGNMSGVKSITMYPLGTVDGRNVAQDGSDLDAHIADTANPHSTTKAQVGLSNVPNVLQNLVATTAPGLTDDSSLGYSTGSRWIDTTLAEEYVCLDASIGAAIWKDTTAAGGGGGTGNLFLSGNTITTTNLNGPINLLPNGSGEVVLKADPIVALGAATKQYVDAHSTGLTSSIALNNTTWTTLAASTRGTGRIMLSYSIADGFPLVIVDVAKNNAGSSTFSEFRTCNLYGTGTTTINLRWNATIGVQAQTSSITANATYSVTVLGF